MNSFPHSHYLNNNNITQSHLCLSSEMEAIGYVYTFRCYLYRYEKKFSLETFMICCWFSMYKLIVDVLHGVIQYEKKDVNYHKQ